jgi:BirA family transcriptional regulator, biotin operon repressor / biotin---[acetyl-CoA-carboxylase] ligase
LFSPSRVRAETAAGVAARPAARYDGASARSIAERLGVPAVYTYASVASTMDVAHALGDAGVAAGTVVLADEQTAGRGRHGSAWRSEAAQGIWLTLLERPADPSGLAVMSLRVGLSAARALDEFAAEPVRVKWPNDLFVSEGKLAGVLVESRWRGARPDWVAIGLGVNVQPPREMSRAAGLRDGTSRLDVLAALVPRVRAAVARRGSLDAIELTEFAARDHARNRRCVTPARGVVAGVTADGELAVHTARGIEYYRAGSLLLEEGA